MIQKQQQNYLNYGGTFQHFVVYFWFKNSPHFY